MRIKVFMHSPAHYEYLCELGNALEKYSNLDITYFSAEDYYYRDKIKFDLVNLYPNPAKFKGTVNKIWPHFTSIISFARKFFSVRPEIVHFQHFRHHELDWPLLLVAKLAGIKTIVTVHNFLPHEAKAIDRPIYWLIYRLADHLIAHTNHTADKLSREMKIDRGRITVIPHGSLGFQVDHTVDKEMACNQLNIPSAATVILFFGRVRNYKGLDLLIKAFQNINDPTTILLVAGANAAESAGKMEVKERIIVYSEFIEPDKVKYYFSCADLVVLPYRRIDQSGVLFLALSSGRAVLGSRVGGIGEVIEDGVSGFLCEPDDLESLTKRLKDILAHRGDLGRIGENGRRVANETYSWSAIAAQTVDLYKAQIA